jgi:hypothetical protein
MIYSNIIPEKTFRAIQINLLLVKQSQLHRHSLGDCKDKTANEILDDAESSTPRFRTLYIRCKDAQAILDTDPAADCIQEIINPYQVFAKSIALPMQLPPELRACCPRFSPDMHTAESSCLSRC